MKISLLIATIIVALASFVASRQQLTISSLETEWETLKTTAIAKEISLDPDSSFRPKRRRAAVNRSARDLAIKDFADELIDFLQKTKAARNIDSASQADFEEEMINLLDKLTSMNADDFKILAKIIGNDSSIAQETKTELFSMSLMFLSSENPEVALALLDEQTEAFGATKQKGYLLPTILSQLAAKDPDAAAAWILKQEDSDLEESGDLKLRTIAMTARNDMNTAIVLIDSLNLENPAEAISRLARYVKPGNQSAFLNALNAKDITPTEKKNALEKLASSPLIKDFEEASTWLASDQVSDEDHTTILNAIDYYNVSKSPEKWLSWMSENNADVEVTADIIRGWTRDNFVASGEWIKSQEEGPAKDAAAKSYASTLSTQEPAAAAAWAETLPPSDDRTRLLRTIHSNLKAKDPAAAAALAEKHQLSQ